MKKLFIGFLCCLLSLCFIFSAVSCDGKTDGETIKLSFKSSSSYDYLKSINGQKVEINGYLATSSPVDGSFIFLMNLPYQSCPFCVPNTSQLSNTMEVYPKKGETFTYTNQAVKVTGTLEVATSKDTPFTDRYGYEFNFKIVDASYTVLKGEDLSEKSALWQKISSTDIINDIYSMYDYLNFVCCWNTYFINTYTDSDGIEHKGFFLYASDALTLIETDGKQWNYGFKEGYFDDIINRIRNVDATAFNDLIENIEKAKALAEKAYSELKNGNYTYQYQYVEKFDTYDNVYTITNGQELQSENDSLYYQFADWLGGWEL